MRNLGRGIATVDVEAINAALHNQRLAYNLSGMAPLSEQMGIGRNTLYRMGYGIPPDAQNLAAILFWLGERQWWIKPRDDQPQ
jgi:DNA-binding phage protein